MAASQTGARQVPVTINARRKLGVIPADFPGLGYEISSVSVPGLLSAKNNTYVQLVRTLSSQGVIRIGGNTSDDAFFERDGRPVSAPKGTVVNAANLAQLGTFLDATGWRLIWGLNLGSGSEEQAVTEAQAVASAVNDKLLAFEIGNEPDLFSHGTPHRPGKYGYDEYLAEFRRYRKAVRAKLPAAPFAGPDVAGATDWVSRLAGDEGADLKLLTHHYYRECANPSSTLDKLLHPDPKLAPQLEALRSASAKSHVPYRICETNSFCGGGRPGVSDTFGAALWVLELMFNLALADCAGLNLETGVNQLGFISSYSPIAEENGSYTAQPGYYGMLAFSQGGQGERVALDCDASGINLSAFAVVNARKLSLTIINKDESAEAEVSLYAPGYRTNATLIRLTAPSLHEQHGIMLGGAPVARDGAWAPLRSESIRGKAGRYEARVPAASAAILSWAS